MKLILHGTYCASDLGTRYAEAFQQAVELAVVSAYLTEWNDKLVLNPKCKRFRLIIGKDFGITRKRACQDVMHWLPSNRKSNFLVAERLSGFHPKAAFWKTAEGACYALIGSSNLTAAAFDTNWEANGFSKLSASQYRNAQDWLERIEAHSMTVTSDWLAGYEEARLGGSGGRRGSSRSKEGSISIAEIELPRPPDVKKIVNARRAQYAAHLRQRAALMRLFRRCASGALNSHDFYESLKACWSVDAGNRITGWGWEMRGKAADFQDLSQSFLRIVSTKGRSRDDVIVEEIDGLSDRGNPARGAFFSEMLCLEYPNAYAILNDPVEGFLREVGYRPPHGASEGDRYLHIVRSLRAALAQNPDHPAKNLLELDGVLWKHVNKEDE